MLEVYPIGKAIVPGSLDAGVFEEYVKTIAALPKELRQAVEGCRDLDHHIRDGAWSIRALVHHIADSHMNAYMRTKHALTEDEPTVKTYDEVAWSRLPDSRIDVQSSLDLVEALHARWVVLLKGLDAAAMERPYRMPGGDPRPMWRLPAIYAWHGRHHVAQIEQAREHFRL